MPGPLYVNGIHVNRAYVTCHISELKICRSANIAMLGFNQASRGLRAIHGR